MFANDSSGQLAKQARLFEVAGVTLISPDQKTLFSGRRMLGLTSHDLNFKLQAMAESLGSKLLGKYGLFRACLGIFGEQTSLFMKDNKGFIKGNQWLISPDHKAGYFLGGYVGWGWVDQPQPLKQPSFDRPSDEKIHGPHPTSSIARWCTSRKTTAGLRCLVEGVILDMKTHSELHAPKKSGNSLTFTIFFALFLFPDQKPYMSGTCLEDLSTSLSWLLDKITGCSSCMSNMFFLI